MVYILCVSPFYSMSKACMYIHMFLICRPFTVIIAHTILSLVFMGFKDKIFYFSFYYSDLRTMDVCIPTL